MLQNEYLLAESASILPRTSPPKFGPLVLPFISFTLPGFLVYSPERPAATGQNHRPPKHFAIFLLTFQRPCNLEAGTWEKERTWTTDTARCFNCLTQEDQESEFGSFRASLDGEESARKFSNCDFLDFAKQAIGRIRSSTPSKFQSFILIGI